MNEWVIRRWLYWVSDCHCDRVWQSQWLSDCELDLESTLTESECDRDVSDLVSS